MPDLSKTHICMILDRSGSMETCAESTIEGFNSFLAEQKDKPGEATVSLYQFDHEYQTVFENRSIEDAPNLTGSTFQPRGLTALYDAIGTTINNVGKQLAALRDEERPGKVIVVIITDGYENRSQEFTADQINDMIDHQESKYNWEFVFVGANQDAIATAGQLGIHHNNALTYGATQKGTQSAFQAISANTTKYRTAGVRGQSMTHQFFEDSDRSAQEAEVNS